jgi:hypothetical protein
MIIRSAPLQHLAAACLALAALVGPAGTASEKVL